MVYYYRREVVVRTSWIFEPWLSVLLLCSSKVEVWSFWMGRSTDGCSCSSGNS
ncbi:hypothetical protein HanPSC8_Chr14g0597351 [Helianthus annuus]|nr:hypothetical protein HanLR1_Chr14g0510871 [Helianthus annuus]KAJ0838657.1 hypothetical protein HanPSC8_Chr14g0597351 [Helianthus annuus]